MSLTLKQMLANDVKASFTDGGAVIILHNILKYADKLADVRRSKRSVERTLADLRLYVKQSYHLMQRYNLQHKLSAWLFTAYHQYLPNALMSLEGVDEAEVGNLGTVLSLALKVIDDYRG